MRAFSHIEVKQVQEEQRTLQGIASTPTPDRVQDVVNPMGMQQRGPVNLFLYHDHKMPVGIVSFGKPTKNGIPFTAQIPNVIEEGTVKERVNEAWHSVKYKLLQAVSIGFVPIDDGYEVLRSGGLLYKTWEILELSMIGVPCNPEALISAFKACDPAGIRSQLGLELSDTAERQALINRTLRGAVKLHSASTKPNLHGAVLLNRPKQ